MGVLLGIAGASFGVALSLGSGWFPPATRVWRWAWPGAGNSGTVLAVLFAPPLAMRFGWQAVYGFAALTMLLPMAVMWFAAKEPPDREHQTFRQHIACLFEKDGWAFSLIYVVTFGGFIGLASFPAHLLHDQFKVTKVEAGQPTMLATLMGSAVRVVGGWISDRVGGVNTLRRAGRGGGDAHAVRHEAARWPPAPCSSCSASRAWARATARCSSWCRCAGRSPPRWPVR